MTTRISAWLAWFSATAFVFFQFLVQTSNSVMIPALMQSFQLNPLQVGMLASSYFYSYVILQLPAGLLVDRYGARRILLGGSLLLTLSLWLFAHAHSYAVAQLSRVLMGVGAAPVIGATFAAVAQWFPERRFTLMIGLTDTLGMLGGVAGEAYLAHWVTRAGWRSTVLGCVVVGLVIALLIYTCVRDAPLRDAAAQRALPTTAQPVAKLSSILRVPQIWLNGIYVALVWGVTIGFTGLWAVPFLQAQYQLTLQTAANASALVFVGVAVGTPLLGWLADNYYSRRRALMLSSTAMGLVALSAALYLPQLTLPALCVLLFIFGFSTGSYIVSFAIVRETTLPAARATAMSFTNMMSLGYGSPILQPLIGYWLGVNAPGIKTQGTAQFSAVHFKTAFLSLPLSLSMALLSIFLIKTTVRAKLTQRDEGSTIS